jgi:mRNA-degrading endonuclease YafQ of YafQ-DinJ toxin-antitoxin module
LRWVLKGEKREAWSFAVEENLRIIFVYIKEGVLFVDIGKHEEVY